jgi:glycosyltransferase involved in cell wall biosynthesis
MNSESHCVLQICGDTVGGIRRHVHSILLGATSDAPRYAYAFSSLEADQRFYDDLDEVSRSAKFLLPLKIRKRPSTSDIWNIVALVLTVKRNNIRVVHGHGAKAGVYARLLKIFCDVSVVYTPHGGVLHDAFSGFEQKFYITVERLLTKITDLVVVESEYSKAQFLEKIGKPHCPLVVNYNGVAVDNTELSKQVPIPLKKELEDDVHIGIFSRFHPMKGVDLAIQVCAELAHSGDNCVSRRFYLHVFGGGSGRTELEQLADRLGCKRLVVFHGDVPRPDAFMNFLDVILIPSRFESFSYVAAEALMMRVPVVASRVGGLQEVLKDGSGLLVAEHNPAIFANAIRRIFEEPGLAVSLIERGYDRYQRLFTEARMLKCVESLYNDLIQRRGPR